MRMIPPTTLYYISPAISMLFAALWPCAAGWYTIEPTKGSIPASSPPPLKMTDSRDRAQLIGSAAARSSHWSCSIFKPWYLHHTTHQAS